MDSNTIHRLYSREETPLNVTFKCISVRNFSRSVECTLHHDSVLLLYAHQGEVLLHLIELYGIVITTDNLRRQIEGSKLNLVMIVDSFFEGLRTAMVNTRIEN